MLTYEVIGKIRRVLGCGPTVAGKLYRMRPAGLWTKDLSDSRFSRVAWRAFAEYRAEVIAGGGDDPMWDLVAPVPVELALAEGGAS